MEKKDKISESSFSFVEYKIHKSTLILSDTEISRKMHFEINPSGEFVDEDKFILSLDVHVNDENHYFDVELEMRGTFMYKATDLERLIKFISINAPAIMFPYIRAYVSTLTSLSGIPTIMMPTINMEPVGKQLLEIIKEKINKA